jgi:hypothetical protein
MANWSFEVSSMRTLAVLVGLATAAWCDNSLTRQERKEGFELLFNGKTLSRWHSIRVNPAAGAWHARKGVLTYDPGESWLASDESYYDFVLRLEYRATAASSGAILIRASRQGPPGMEFPLRAARPGEWNQVEISVIKRQLTATLNGEKIVDLNLDDTKPAHGLIGLQAHATGMPIEFRNIRVKVLRIGPGFPPEQ